MQAGVGAEFPRLADIASRRVEKLAACLDRFTLFQYEFEVSAPAMLGIGALAVAVCSLSAIYPGRVAASRSSAESLQYE